MFAALGTRITRDRVRGLIVVALLLLSLGIGLISTPQSVAAKPKRTHCIHVHTEAEWYAWTGELADADFVGGFYCYKS